MFSILTSKIFGGLSILLLIALAVLYWRLTDVQSELATTKDRIDNPVTGYVARLAQSETNVATLTGLVTKADADFKALQKASKDSSDAAARAMAGLAIQSRAVLASANKLLALPPTAAPGTLEACQAGANILKTGAP